MASPQGKSRSITIERKLALVGLGTIAAAHVDGAARVDAAGGQDRLTISAVVDSDRARAEHWRNKIAADAKHRSASPPAALDDYRRLLEPEHRPDMVSILLPHHLHLEAASVFLKAGIAVQMQKPISLGLRDARQMIDLVAATGTPLVVCEQFVLGRATRLLLDWVRSGRQIGTPRFMSDHNSISLEYQLGTPWRRRRGAAGGGMFLDFGVHKAHWMLEAFGPCESVMAHVGVIRSEPDGRAADIEDFGAAILRFAGGMVCQITVVTPPRGQEHGHQQLWADSGCWVPGRGVISRSGAVPPQLDDSAVPADVPACPFAHSYLELLARMRDPAAPIIGEPARAMEALAVIYACLESSCTGRAVQVADVLSGQACEYERTVWEARPRAGATT